MIQRNKKIEHDTNATFDYSQTKHMFSHIFVDWSSFVHFYKDSDLNHLLSQLIEWKIGKSIASLICGADNSLIYRSTVGIYQLGFHLQYQAGEWRTLHHHKANLRDLIAATGLVIFLKIGFKLPQYKDRYKDFSYRDKAVVSLWLESLYWQCSISKLKQAPGQQKHIQRKLKVNETLKVT